MSDAVVEYHVGDRWERLASDLPPSWYPWEDGRVYVVDSVTRGLSLVWCHFAGTPDSVLVCPGGALPGRWRRVAEAAPACAACDALPGRCWRHR